MPDEQRDRRCGESMNLCGKHLKRIRRNQGLTLTMVQAALTHEYGIVLDRTSLGRIEKGTRAVTDIEFGALRDLLDVSESELLWGTQVSTKKERKQSLRRKKRRYSRSSSHQTS